MNLIIVPRNQHNQKLYRDRELGQILGSNGREYVKEYGVVEQAGKWHKIFNDVLGEDDQETPSR